MNKARTPFRITEPRLTIFQIKILLWNINCLEIEINEDEMGGIYEENHKLLNIREQFREKEPCHLVPRNILDLPNEILAKIFECVDEERRAKLFGFEFSCHKNEGAPKDLKNVRLVCQRFNDTSAHLLLPFVDVGIDMRSLSRLNEISNHPIISRGVRKIRVNLRFYDRSMANSFTSLQQYYRQIRLMWMQERLIEPTSTYLREYFYLGQEDFRTYSNNWKEQEKLLKDGQFYQAIAKAFVKMPGARSLQLHDIDTSTQKFLPREKRIVDDKMQLPALRLDIRFLQRSWDGYPYVGGRRPPVDVLVKLPYFIHEAGGVLNELAIDVIPRNCSLLASSSEDLIRLTNAVQDLKKFCLATRYTRLPMDDQEPTGSEHNVKNLRIFLKHVLATESLESLWLDCLGMHIPMDGSLLNIGPILLSRPRERLQWAFFRSVAFDFARFRQFICNTNGCRPAQLDYLCFDTIQLTSGSWAHALHMLQREQVAKEFALGHPRGAECPSWTYSPFPGTGEIIDAQVIGPKLPKSKLSADDVKPTHGDLENPKLPWRVWKRVFRRPGGLPERSMAEKYILGEIEENPLERWKILLRERASLIRQEQANQELASNVAEA